MFMWSRFLVFAWFLALTPAWSVALADTTDSVELLRQGDDLADAGDYAGALIKYKDAYQLLMPSLRNMSFKRPVSPKLMSRSSLRKHLGGLIDEEYTNADLKMMGETLKVFGLAPTEMDLKPTLLNLYTEEIAGFYEPKDESMFLIADLEEQAKRGFLAELLAPSGFNKDEQKIILAHEMAHALHDQHFDLDQLQEAVESDDDRLLALMALIEGDATVVMFAEQQRMTGQSADITSLPPAAMDFSFNAMKVFLPFASGKAFANAPKILKDSLLFPYHKGAVFVTHLTNRGGWSRVNRAWSDLPQSTEQILHPEKYLATPRDNPIEIELNPAVAVSQAGWESLGSNVMGEFQIQVLLDGVPFSKVAAAGWGGDRYQTYVRNDQRAMIWSTRWDADRDAHQFGVAYQYYLRNRLGLIDASDASDTYGVAPFTGEFTHTVDDRVYSIRRRDQDVFVVEGFDKTLTAQVLEQLLGQDQ